MNDIFITHININKVRHLENLEIELSKDERKHLILTGKNGSGKTSVLEVLDNKLEHKNETRQIVLKFNVTEDVKRMWERGDFVIAFQKARRLTEMRKPEGPKRFKLQPHYNEEPASMFLQYIVNLQAEKAFARDDGDTKTAENIEQWFVMFEQILQDLFEDDTLQLEFDRKNFNFVLLTKDHEPFDFNTLADGYSGAISILTDLMMRMEHNRTEGYDMQGIVLIDEIETHLHVELQKKILSFLTNFFPRIQFIVSTHSPFVLNSLENAVVYDLENQVRVEDLSPYSYEAIVERYFDVDQYSDRIKAIMQEYETLLKKCDKTELQHARLLELRNYLKKIPADFAPELVAQFQSLELQKGFSQ